MMKERKKRSMRMKKRKDMKRTLMRSMRKRSLQKKCSWMVTCKLMEPTRSRLTKSKPTRPESASWLVFGTVKARDEVVVRNRRVAEKGRDRLPRDLRVPEGELSRTITSGRPIRSQRKDRVGTCLQLVATRHSLQDQNRKYPISRLTSMTSALIVETWTRDDLFKDTSRDHQCARWFKRRRNHNTRDSKASVGNLLVRWLLTHPSLRNLNVAQTGSFSQEKAKGRANLEARTLS